MTSDLQTRIDEAITEASEEIAQAAVANVAKWGLQTTSFLVKKMAEELGEVARAQLEVKGEISTSIPTIPARVIRVQDEAVDLGALCVQMIILCTLCGYGWREQGRDPESRLAEVQSLATDVLGLELIEGEIDVDWQDGGGDPCIVVRHGRGDEHTTKLARNGDRVRLWREVRS